MYSHHYYMVRILLHVITEGLQIRKCMFFRCRTMCFQYIHRKNENCVLIGDTLMRIVITAKHACFFIFKDLNRATQTSKSHFFLKLPRKGNDSWGPRLRGLGGTQSVARRYIYFRGTSIQQRNLKLASYHFNESASLTLMTIRCFVPS